MKKAVLFGAGNIGRGFIGGLLAHSGYQVTFADVNQTILDAINQEKGYTIHICDAVCSEEIVENVCAIHSADPALVDVVAQAEVIATAVGLTILPRIAPTIAKGIALRKSQGVEAGLNIIACENAIRASSQLKTAVYTHLSQAEIAYCEQWVGFPDCSVDRIVPPVHNERLVDVSVEAFYEWNVERASFKGEIPAIKGMNLADDLMAYIERKLFTLNTGHAVTAYLGALKGHQTVQDSFQDEAIQGFVRTTMAESGAGLVEKHGFDPVAHQAYIEKICKRFQNTYLVDEVDRVGRAPLRKLAPSDRLAMPLMTAKGYGLPYSHLCVGMAAAMGYENPQDEESVALQAKIQSQGFGATLQEVTGIRDVEVLSKVEGAYLALSALKQ